MKSLKKLLDAEVALRNCSDELCNERPDPLMVARRYKDEFSALTCALFAYGNVKAIISILESFDMSLIDQEEPMIRDALQSHYYRFQTSEDIIQWFITLRRLKKLGGVETVFTLGYQNGGIIGGLNSLISTLYEINPYSSSGYCFLIGKPITSSSSAMKRWMMYLRWMVRKDHLDMGLWRVMKPSELIMPLDTHTFKVSQKLGLLSRKQCDLKAAMELTERLREFDRSDPIKYDFALYRLGQEKKV